MDTRDLLIEIGTEEIPARMIDGGVADLRTRLEEVLAAGGVPGTDVQTFATPRRLAVRIRGIAAAQPDREEVVTGPSVGVAFGPDGTPTRAGEGFAKSQGVAPAALERVPGPKGEVVAVRRQVVGRPTAQVLAEALPGLIAKLTFPKSMRWDSSLGPFVRPVHWIVALFGGDVIPFHFAGVDSGRATRGHRFLAPGAVDLAMPSDYEATLAAIGVVPRPEDRLATVRAAVAAEEQARGVTFVGSDALLREVANLVEYPIFAVGTFDADFLRLPREVLVTAMASHQRYFAVQDADGNLKNAFGVVCNTKARDMGVVVRGNERVLAARLYDARFFHEQDRKNGLAAMAARLPERLFLKGVGDMAQKTGWVRELALAVAGTAGLSDGDRATLAQAADHCKADLMSAMVGEFPELQGIMGAYYARPYGEPETPVATAIREHYLPRFAGDTIPATAPGAVLALADRLDSILRCFAAGAIPTGSKDPLALRRAAIGVLRILMGSPCLGAMTLDALLRMGGSSGMKDATLERAVAAADSGIAGAPVAKQRVLVTEFFAERFKGILADEGVPTDVANAVVPFLFDANAAPPAELVARACAIRDYAAATADFRDFLDNVYKRVGNLLKQADEKLPDWRKAIVTGGLAREDVDFDRFLDLDLEKAVESTRRAALTAYHHARGSGAHGELLAALYSFKDPLARFFGSGRDGVPVLIEDDEHKRLARLALLHRVFALFDWFADFGRISTR